MADDSKWEDIFPLNAHGSDGKSDAASNSSAGGRSGRRAARPDEPGGTHPSANERREAPVGYPRRSNPPVKRRRSLAPLWALLAFLVVAAGTTAAVWVVFEDQVRAVLGWELPTDYEGTGNGEAVVVTISAGQIGADVATTLHDAGVTLTFSAFYDLLLNEPVPPVFQPGSFELEKEMSAESALTALLDPTNLVTSRVVIPEGSTLTQTLSRLAEATGLPLADFEATAANPPSLGVPPGAPSLEGFLFPATYDFEPGTTAAQMLQTMADRMTQALDTAGVAPGDRLRVLTMAALIQKEGGSAEDFLKVSRVFRNRIDQGMRLQSDATVSYGSGGTSILTTDAERADASNPYNTYANPGLPVGPISAPGDDAIFAALNPAEGNWLYFVLVNGATGETKFSETFAEHEVAVAEWQAWYKANPGWDN